MQERNGWCARKRRRKRRRTDEKKEKEKEKRSGMEGNAGDERVGAVGGGG